MASARYAFENASKIGDPITALDHWMVSASNLGYFSESAKLFEEIGAPSKGRFTDFAERGFFNGMFVMLSRFIKEAKVMELDLSGLDTATYDKVTRLILAGGTAQETVLTMLDVAGEFLRGHKCFYIGKGPSFVFEPPEYGGLGEVHVQLAVPLGPEETSEMNVDLAERIALMPMQIPDVFCVSFVSRKHVDSAYRTS